jgi:hypothetical protein
VKAKSAAQLDFYAPRLKPSRMRHRAASHPPKRNIASGGRRIAMSNGWRLVS